MPTEIGQGTPAWGSSVSKNRSVEVAGTHEWPPVKRASGRDMDMEAGRGRPTPVPALVAGPHTPTPRNGRRAVGHPAGRAQLVEVEAAAIREAASRVLAGETISSVVREWNERGLTTAGGGPWRVNSLSSLLVQPRLTGPPRIL